MPVISSVRDHARSPQLDGALVVGIVLGVEEVDLEFAAVGTLNCDVELLFDVLGVNFEKLDFLTSVVVAGSLFLGSLIFH